MARAYLPDYRYADGIKKTYQDKFGGYNHTLSCEDGEIWDEKNMTSDHYPVMAARQKRYVETGYYNKNVGYDRTYDLLVLSVESVDDNPYARVALNYGVHVHRWTNTHGMANRHIAWLNDVAVIMPDKMYYNMTTDVCGSLEASVGPMSGGTQDGTYAGQTAAGNTLVLPGADLSEFNVGDSVTISGVGGEVTAIIREKTTVLTNPALVFYENTFLSGSHVYTDITVTRAVPNMEFICSNENRIWGCLGDTIYASKLGDPLNWNVFDGLSSDSYVVDTGTAGSFTGCCSYRGYPTFFKEDHIFKVYGTQPSNYQTRDTMTLGVESGSGLSLAVANEVLYYKSRAGIMAYNGSVPRCISEVFGEEGKTYMNAVGGTDGIKYYVSLQKPDISTHTLLPLFFVYDPRYGIWHKEDDLRVERFASKTGYMYCMAAAGTTMSKQMILNGEEAVAEDFGGFAPFTGALESSFSSFVEFGDFVAEDPNKKGISKIQYRCLTGENVPIEWAIAYDGGDYETVCQSYPHTSYIDTQGKKRSFYLPLTPHRADNYKLKITGHHGWRLFSLSRDEYSGSELQKH